MIGLSNPGLYGACSYGYDVHHITHRGSGGDDVLNNLICLCRAHHNMAHTGQIPRLRLREILNEYFEV